MFKTVRRYIFYYYIYCCIKASRKKYNSFLKAIARPAALLANISIDFIINLPKSKGYKNIIVVVDRLSKYRYILLYKEINTKATIELFYRYV